MSGEIMRVYEVDTTGASQADIDMLIEELRPYDKGEGPEHATLGDVSYIRFSSYRPLTNSIVKLPDPYRLKD